MSTLFSRQCEYALQAVTDGARETSGPWTSIRYLSERLRAPYHFLGKILQDLVHKGILRSRKGHDRGFALARPASHMTLSDVVAAIDGMSYKDQCIMGFSECSARHPCAIHEQWEESRTELHDLLSKRSIAEAAKGMHTPEFTPASGIL
jgi:Rrf2 family iron-sulfur cluster assembly transcriptional regulator